MPGNMPLLEVDNWLHQVTCLYAAAIPIYIFVNNHLGPKTMEPMFCRDFLMSHFEKIASSPSAVQAAQAGSSSSATTASFVPKLQKLPFARFGNAAFGSGNVRSRVAGITMKGLAALFK
ncbi:hypothetical protein MIR68_008248 [Amoeboaphelidium protococcarum]|nr:hypothetical protein MIR68_008248 [Amoeboaphelidium protococcarum]